MLGEIRRVGVVKEIIERGYDWMTEDTPKGEVAGGIEGRVDTDGY
jgi:hypothetical protein